MGELDVMGDGGAGVSHTGSHYPRTLVVTAGSTAADNGSGFYLRSLFGDWPADRLAQLSWASTGAVLQVPASARFGSGTRYLDSSRVPVDHLLRRGIQGRVSGAASVAGVKAGDSDASIRSSIHRNFRAAADLSPIVLRRADLGWVDSFSPDVVYSMLGSGRVIGTTLKIIEHSGVPVVPHFQDDWLGTLYTSGEMLGTARRMLMHRLRRLMRSARRGLAISPLMAHEYGRQFGVPFLEVANPVSAEYFELPRRNRRSAGSALRFMYVGGLHLGRQHSLRQVARALEAIPNACLEVYCPERDVEVFDADLRGLPNVRLAGSLEPSRIPDALCEADVLIHVEALDPAVARFTRLSLSRKIPQYLASARPILAFGPANCASMQVLAEVGGALTVDGPEELARAVTLLAGAPDWLGEQGDRGRLFARTYMREGAVRDRLRTALAESVAMFT